MKFVHTFWSKPLKQNRFGDFENNLKVILSNYALSAGLCKLFGYEIVLFTDSYGKELLDFIPYDNINIVDYLDDENICFSAMMKFEALKYIDLGDVIIDGDIFIYNRDIFDIIEKNNSDILVSFVEPLTITLFNQNNLLSFSEMIYLFQDKEFCYGLKPPVNFNDIYYTNTSLIKINNQELKELYVNQYIYNYNLLKDIHFKYSWPDIFVEQYFLRKLCENNNFNYDTVIKDYGLVTEEKKEGFIHLANNKRNKINFVEENLKNISLELYNNYIQRYNDQIIPYIQ